MFFLNWYHTHTDNIFLDGCWCTCNFSSTISWFFFIALTASWHWFYALWLVSMQSCWMIFLAHTANSSPLVVSSTIVLTYWFVAAKKNFLLHQKFPSVSNFHLLIVVAGIKVMNLLTSRSSWLHVLGLSFSSVNIAKYFVLPLFEDLSVGSKYCYHLAAFRSDWNKARSSIRRVASSTNAIKSAKLGSLLLPFHIANTCRFRLSLTCVKLCNH